MQEGGKIAVAVSVTFMSGVVVGWLLNTYTRKVRRASPSQYCRAAAGVGTAQPFLCLLLLHIRAGLGKDPVKHAEQGQEHLRRTGQWPMMRRSLEHPQAAGAPPPSGHCVQSKPAVVMLDTQPPQLQCCRSLCPRPWQQQQFAVRLSQTSGTHQQQRQPPSAASHPCWWLVRVPGSV